MTAVKIIIPWRPEPSRQAGFDWLKRYYAHRFGADAVHVEVDGSAEPFNKSRSLNLAVSRYPGHVCVLCDADAFICDWSLRYAISQASQVGSLLIPHNSVCRMTRSQSQKVLERDPATPISGRMYRANRRRACPGGLWVVHSDLFMRYQMNELFHGWGCEDTEFLRRIPSMRLSGPLFHLWHDPAPRDQYPRNRRALGRLRMGRIDYKGIPAQQHPSTESAFRQLLQSRRPSQILEIGTAAGGLTLMLHDLAQGAAIRTYDVRPCPNAKLLARLGIDCRLADPLSQEQRSDLSEFVRRSGLTMVLCDGGNKPAEVAYMADVLKPGDLLLAHDYAPSREYFEVNIKGVRWDWCEITDTALTGLAKLKLRKCEELAGAMWLCTEVHEDSELALPSI